MFNNWFLYELFKFISFQIPNRLANKNVYVVLYGMIGLVFSGTYAYFNGTITTLEKRYHISSKTTGTISVGNDISQLFASAILSYYAGKGHRPRWMAFGKRMLLLCRRNISLFSFFFFHSYVSHLTFFHIGLGTIVIFCLMNIMPHFLYGPGEDALSLTAEYGGQFDANSTIEVLEKEKRKTLCNTNGIYRTHFHSIIAKSSLNRIFILTIRIWWIGNNLHSFSPFYHGCWCWWCFWNGHEKQSIQFEW